MLIVYDNQNDIDIALILSVTQYMLMFIKKYLNYMIRKKIKNNLYYDDILTVAILIYAADYCIVFRFILTENVENYRRILVIFNFIIIQIRSVLNVNVIFVTFRYCFRKKWFYIMSVPAIYLLRSSLLIIVVQLYEYMIQYYIFVAMKAFWFLLYRIIPKDSERTKELMERNMHRNGYLDIKLQQGEIDEFDS